MADERTINIEGHEYTQTVIREHIANIYNEKNRGERQLALWSKDHGPYGCVILGRKGDEMFQIFNRLLNLVNDIIPFKILECVTPQELVDKTPASLIFGYEYDFSEVNEWMPFSSFKPKVKNLTDKYISKLNKGAHYSYYRNTPDYGGEHIGVTMSIAYLPENLNDFGHTVFRDIYTSIIGGASSDAIKESVMHRKNNTSGLFALDIYLLEAAYKLPEGVLITPAVDYLTEGVMFHFRERS